MLILEIMAAYDLIIGAGHVPYDLEIHCFTYCFYLPTNEISTNVFMALPMIAFHISIFFACVTCTTMHCIHS